MSSVNTSSLNASASGFSPAPEYSAGIYQKRVLVAEEDPATHEVLQSLLSGRGHHVDIVVNGEQAMQALKTHDYDVVLVDFHLPKMDGLEVATTFRTSHSGAEAPRFVAITADMKGLLEHAAGCDNFDEVVAKPFDLDDICNVVEGDDDTPVGMPEHSAISQPALPVEDQARPDAADTPEHARLAPANAKTDPALNLNFDYLQWPDDFDGDRLSARAMQASLGDGSFKAIIVSAAATQSDLSALWRTKFLHVLPVIDMAGALGRSADLNGSGHSILNQSQIADTVRDFENRRSLIHRDFIYTDDQDEKLLSRIFVAGGSLVAGHNPASKRFVDYNCMLECGDVERQAGKLVDEGMLRRRFFDRLHVCDRCGSSRFNIREECAECRSPDLAEEPYLHHFKCAYQGLESDFRQDDALICPKCRKELVHFSVDYDKPGNMIQCRSCGHKGSDPAVGLLCLDCGSHTDGDQASTVDVFSYELTEKAIAFLETGKEFYGVNRKPLHFAELPLELIVAINSHLGAYKNQSVPFTLLDISYRNARLLEVEHGARQFDQARNLFLENLRNVLSKNDRVVKGRGYDFALLAETDLNLARSHLDDIRREATDAVRLDLGVNITAFGAENFV